MSTGCSTLREYTMSVALSAGSVSLTTDVCGSLNLADSLGGEDSLFLYVGADDDSDAAEWVSLWAWGSSLTWDPASVFPPPSPAPAVAPTAAPLRAPSPAPTASLGAPGLVDTFEAFDPGVWLAPCAGCSYAGGSLLVAGDSMFQRTVGAVKGLSRVRGHLVKAGSCSDHFVAVSTLPAISWSWAPTAGTVRFHWCEGGGGGGVTFFLLNFLHPKL